MIHDILFTLLGFPGDLIETHSISSEFSLPEQPSFELFGVKDGYPNLTEAERDQINRIVPLGSYYLYFEEFIKSHALQWNTNQRQSLVYSMALSYVLQDMNKEYVEDIAILEQLLNQEETLPLSHLLQHLQKYLILFPQLYKILQTIEHKHLSGCQLIDYFMSYPSGIPVVTDVIQRILYRLRTICFKQIYAWMIFGSLHDETQEFFIQMKNQSNVMMASNQTTSNTTLEQRILYRLAQAKSISTTIHDHQSSSSLLYHDTDSSFDWITSYLLRYEMIPESHISPALASKILFAGKANLLLQQSSQKTSNSSTTATTNNNSTENISQTHSSAFLYLSKGGLTLSTEEDDDDDDDEEDHDDDDDDDKEDNEGEGEGVEGENKAEGDKDKLTDNEKHTKKENTNTNYTNNTNNPAHLTNCSYSIDEINQFDQMFQQILQQPDQTIELLEQTIEMICTLISARLWTLLQHELGFFHHLQLIRNTYLMGKGELFQSILDEVHSQAIGYDINTRKPMSWSWIDMNHCLNWKILRHASKLINIDEDEMNDLLTLSMDSSNILITQFVLIESMLAIVGYSQFVYPKNPLFVEEKNGLNGLKPSSKDISNEAQVYDPIGIELSTPIQSQMDTIYHLLSQDKDRLPLSTMSLGHLWTNNQPSSQSLNPSHSLKPPSLPSPRGLVYLNSALWIKEMKQVIKGFSFSTQFQPNWLELKSIEPSDRYFYEECYQNQIMNSKKWPMFPTNAIKYESRIGDLLLGSYAICLQSDTQGIQTLGKGSLSQDISHGLVFGVSFHAYLLEEMGISSHNPRKIKHYARIYLARTGKDGVFRLPTDRIMKLNLANPTQINETQFTQPSNASNSTSNTTSASQDPFENIQDYILVEKIIDLDYGMSSSEIKSLSSVGKLKLEVDYSRVINYTNNSSSSSSIHSRHTTTHQSISSKVQFQGEVSYRLRMRLIDPDLFPNLPSVGTSLPVDWDLDLPLDLSLYLRPVGGQVYTGIVTSGLLKQTSLTQASSIQSSSQPLSQQPLSQQPSMAIVPHSFSFIFQQLHFQSKTSLLSLPACSPFTSSRYPDTFLAIERLVSQFRSWYSIRLSVQLTPLFQIIFDSESVRQYERMFSLLIKIRLISRALEKLWMAKTKVTLSNEDRIFCHLRQTMHYFISNVLYYLQVDVVDSEYIRLIDELSQANDFQMVLRLHRSYLANVLRLMCLDHMNIQETFERLFHLCIRFICLHHLQQHQEQRQQEETFHDEYESKNVSPPIVIPTEEMEDIYKEFIQQIAMLLQLMKKLDTRGFLFRLDFNNYFSNLILFMNK